MGNKKLKICETPFVTSECWTYYKMIILQTEPVFIEWLTSHMDLFLNDCGSATFGDHAEPYTLSYFNEILDIIENRIDDVSEKEIVDYVISKINEEYYVKLDLDFNKLFGIEAEEKNIHEAIIYGYDEEKRIVYIPLLNGERFQEVEVPFEMFVSAYGSMWEQFMTPPEGRAWKYVRRHYVLGLTLLRVNKEYKNLNAQFDFIHKLEYERKGFVYEKKSLDGESRNVYHTGLACLHHLAEYIDGFNQNNFEKIPDHCILGYKKSYLKIYEHQSMLRSCMSWYIEKTKIYTSELEDLCVEYDACLKSIYNIILLNIKYYMTHEDSIAVRIVQSTLEVYEKEKDILKRFHKTAYDAYLLTLGE